MQRGGERKVRRDWIWGSDVLYDHGEGEIRLFILFGGGRRGKGDDL